MFSFRGLLFKLFTCLLGLFTLIPESKAGLYLEPSLGYSLGTLETGLDSDGDYSAKGPAFGLKLGASIIPMVFVAADVMYLMTDFDAKKDGVENADGKSTLAGLTVGLNLPILLRFWASYFFYNKFDLKDSDGTQKLSGSAIKLGVGYSLAPYVALNLEYLLSSYSKYKDVSGNETDLPLSIGGDSFDPKYNTFILSLGIPL